MDFLKTITGKIVTGIVSLAVVSAGVAWWETDPATRQQILSVSGRLLGWLVLVILVPWASFAVIGKIAQLQSNRAGAVLVVLMTAVETTLLLWMFGWTVHGATAWVLLLAAMLLAGVYNLLSCDWIAEKLES